VIKAYYIGTVIINGDLPEDTKDLLPVEELREAFSRGMDEIIKKGVEGELTQGFDVKVEKRYSTVYKSTVQ